MKLTDLEAEFIQWTGTGPDDYGWKFVSNLNEATGIKFLCPKCFLHNKGPVGTHMVVCHRFGKVPDWMQPGPGRWVFDGTSLDNLTLNAPPGHTRSVLLLGGECGGGAPWHGFVTNGDASL